MAIQVVANPIMRVSVEVDLIKTITGASVVDIELNDRFKYYTYKHDGTNDYNIQFPKLIKLFENRFIAELSDRNTIAVFFDSVTKLLGDAGSANGYTLNC